PSLNGGELHEDGHVDGVRDLTHRAVAEKPLDAARVYTAPAVLAVIRVHLGRAGVVIGEQRDAVRPGGALGIEVEAVRPVWPAPVVTEGMPSANEDGVGQAVTDRGERLGVQAGGPVAVKCATALRVASLGGLALVPEPAIGVRTIYIANPRHGFV